METSRFEEQIRDLASKEDIRQLRQDVFDAMRQTIEAIKVLQQPEMVDEPAAKLPAEMDVDQPPRKKTSNVASVSAPDRMPCMYCLKMFLVGRDMTKHFLDTHHMTSAGI
jgi:hypothetical protein